MLNGEEGVAIHIEGDDLILEEFCRRLKFEAPPAARIVEIHVEQVEPEGFEKFVIKESERKGSPTVRISPDLPVCDECARELADAANRRYRYPYINCTNCGPRYTVILALPYDRPNTTMKDWPFDEYCDREYHDPANRRFHAQPVACPECGPHYYLRIGDETLRGDDSVIRKTVELLNAGKIVAIKGLGGYHLACDAENAEAVAAMRARKFRKEKPFAVMVQSVEDARRSPIFLRRPSRCSPRLPGRLCLRRRRVKLTGVAPDNRELGIMLPYTPLQHLLFLSGRASHSGDDEREPLQRADCV